MKLPLGFLGVALLVLSGCSSGGGGGGAAGSGGSPTGGSGGSPTGGGAGTGAQAGGGSGGTMSNGGSGGALDAGALTIYCGTPSLVVVRDAAGVSGKSVTIARVPLQLNQSVTGLALSSVKQLDMSDTLVRDWKASDFKGPPGFDGSVTASSTLEYKLALWAETASNPSETAACDLKPWERGGKLKVQGVTNEGGPFDIECSLGSTYNGVGPEPRRFTCAKGVPGWLYEQTGISNVTTPVVVGIAQAGIHVLNDSAADWNGFSADSATLYSYFASDFMKPCTSPPDHFDFPQGTHQLWNGGSSQDTWSGPVASGATESANWMWQLAGMQFPAGFCFKPDPNPPTDPAQMCQEPVLSVTLRGNSSAGAWEWESDLFQCYDLSGT